MRTIAIAFICVYLSTILLEIECKGYEQNYGRGKKLRNETHEIHPVLIYSNGTHICNGALISRTFVLTAAQCLINKPVKSLTIRLGPSNVTEQDENRNVTQIILRKQSKNQNSIDLGLATLSKPLFTIDITEVYCRGTHNLLPHHNLRITAWRYAHVINRKGTQKVDFAAMPIFNKTECQAYSSYWNQPMNITKHIFCAVSMEGSPKICKAAMGAPAVTENKLVGVVINTGCIAKGIAGPRSSYGIFINPVRWIENHVHDLPLNDTERRKFCNNN